MLLHRSTTLCCHWTSATTFWWVLLNIESHKIHVHLKVEMHCLYEVHIETHQMRKIKLKLKVTSIIIFSKYFVFTFSLHVILTWVSMCSRWLSFIPEIDMSWVHPCMGWVGLERLNHVNFTCISVIVVAVSGKCCSLYVGFRKKLDIHIAFWLWFFHFDGLIPYCIFYAWLI